MQIKENAHIGPELLIDRPVRGVFSYADGVLTQYAYSGDKLPWRVKNRLFLHSIGVCGMFTALIEPNPCCMDFDAMSVLASKAEEVNTQIGLPIPVESLVVRTRDVNANARIAGSNPILVIGGVRTESPSFVQLKTEYSPEQRFTSFEEWHSHLPVPMYCMIHEENFALQKKSVHGRIMRLSSDGSWELSLGTNVLHARMIGQNGSRYVGMGGHDIKWLLQNVEMGNMMGVLDLSTVDDARLLVSRLEPYKHQLVKAYESISRVAGKDVVAEFRLYDGYMGSELAGLHVYDFDQQF